MLVSLDKDPEQPAVVTQPVMASQRTWQSLSKPAEGTSRDAKEDPWMHKDPWQQPSSGKELSAGQVMAIEKSLEAKLTEKLQKEDAPMDDVNQRLATLEAKYDSLQAPVATQHAAQQQHNVNMQQQLQQIDGKVDAQAQSFQCALDASLNEQMRKIEQLFNKRRAE